jgi:hypothetical protein
MDGASPDGCATLGGVVFLVLARATANPAATTVHSGSVPEWEHRKNFGIGDRDSSGDTRMGQKGLRGRPGVRRRRLHPSRRS